MSITKFKRENLSKIVLLIEFTHTERKFTAKISSNLISPTLCTIIQQKFIYRRNRHPVIFQ